MLGLWKAWKAKDRLPTLSTSPLEISPKAGEFPTFPPRRRRRRMEKWKTKSRFSTFPPPRFLILKTENTKTGGGLRPPLAQALRAWLSFPSHFKASAPFGALASTEPNQRKETSPSKLNFRAHPALESQSHFRLISHWNQFSISGSFVDWKMLLSAPPFCAASVTIAMSP